MKASTVRQLPIIAYLILAATLVSVAFCNMGCASTTPTFQAPKLQPVAFAIPVPPAERTCNPSPDLSIRTITLKEVETDGSVHIRALTADVLTLIDLVVQNYNECTAHNEARQFVIQAEREAHEELERLIGETDR